MKLLLGCFFLLSFSMSQAKALRISGLEGAPHIIYDSNSPRPGGLVPKFVDLYLQKSLKEKFGLDIEWHQAPASRLLHELETDDLDVLCFLSKNPEREKIYDYSKEPFLIGRNSLIVRKDFIPGHEVQNLQALKNKTIGVMLGVAQPASFSANKIQIFPLTGANITSRTLSLIDKKRIDGVFVHQNQVAEFIVKNSKYRDSLKVVQLPEEPFKVYLAFRKRLSPEIKNFVEQTFFKHHGDYTAMMSGK